MWEGKLGEGIDVGRRVGRLRWTLSLDALVWQALAGSVTGMGCNTVPQGITGAALLCGESVLAGV